METWVQFPAYRPNLAVTVGAGQTIRKSPILIMQRVCKHPKVRVVAREDDVEYVECEECGEVFDADEYQEMSQDGGEETLAENDDA
jgi:Zn ribbon nucleic-acid-binding protein